MSDTNSRQVVYFQTITLSPKWSINLLDFDPNSVPNQKLSLMFSPGCFISHAISMYQYLPFFVEKGNVDVCIKMFFSVTGLSTRVPNTKLHLEVNNHYLPSQTSYALSFS